MGVLYSDNTFGGPGSFKPPGLGPGVARQARALGVQEARPVPRAQLERAFHESDTYPFLWRVRTDEARGDAAPDHPGRRGPRQDPRGRGEPGGLEDPRRLLERGPP